jgi:hypothetical protein
MRALPGCVLLLTALLAVPQKVPNDLLHSDKPVADFTIRPGIKLNAQYGPDGMACHMDLAPGPPFAGKSFITATMSPETVTSILDEIVPPATRGKELVGKSSFQTASCGAVETRAYENVTIGRGMSICPKGHFDIQDVSVTFNRPACSKLTK